MTSSESIAITQSEWRKLLAKLCDAHGVQEAMKRHLVKEALFGFKERQAARKQRQVEKRQRQRKGQLTSRTREIERHLVNEALARDVRKLREAGFILTEHEMGLPQ